jgi:hypothetical protein
MGEKEARSHSQEFEERFGRRKARQNDNLKELSELAYSGELTHSKRFQACVDRVAVMNPETHSLVNTSVMV